MVFLLKKKMANFNYYFKESIQDKGYRYLIVGGFIHVKIHLQFQRVGKPSWCFYNFVDFLT